MPLLLVAMPALACLLLVVRPGAPTTFLLLVAMPLLLVAMPGAPSTSSFLLLVAMPLLLVAMPGAPSSVLAPSSTARSP